MFILVFCIVILFGFISFLIFIDIKANKKNRAILESFETLPFSRQEDMQWKNDILMKQQETLSTVANIGKRYDCIQEQFEKIMIRDTTSSQIISDMSSRISSMNDIMVNKKARGNWGEYQLNTLLSIYAGESQEVFEIQYSLKNGYVGDVALHLPGNDKVMMIDSKFPLENYQNIIKGEMAETVKYEALFKQNIKKHINDIAKKYITNETAEQAVMFVPSEAIYVYICSSNAELIDYAHSKHVLITSPTTLLGVVFTLVNATKDFNRTKHMKDIEKHIISMAEDAKRLVERVEKSQGYLNQLTKSLNETKTSSDKIANKIGKVSDGYIAGFDE